MAYVTQGTYFAKLSTPKEAHSKINEAVFLAKSCFSEKVHLRVHLNYRRWHHIYIYSVTDAYNKHKNNVYISYCLLVTNSQYLINVSQKLMVRKKLFPLYCNVLP